jgi:multidrug efflux pump subunit AcrA (membrane-fusion protein)
MKRISSRMKNAAVRLVAWFKNLSKKKKLGVVVIALVIVVIAGRFLGGAGNGKYTTVPVMKSDITEIVTETGSIQVIGRTDVFSPTTGVVQNVLVANGDNVSVGQELFAVKSTATEQEVQAAYTNYLAAQATLNAASADSFTLRSSMFDAWDTYYKLATGDLYENADGTPKNNQRALPEFHIAQDDWLAAEKKYKDQQIVVAKAQASVASTQLLYEATKDASVKATAVGTVANLAVTTGSSVTVKSLTMTQPVLTITTPGAIEVVVPLNETDSIKAAAGQEAVIDVSAIDGTPYHGIVKRVDTIGTEVSGVVRYNVYIELQETDNRIRSGMNVDAKIVTKKLTDVLSVPNAAVKPYQGGRAVRTVGSKGELIYIPVQIGIKGTERTQIISGISEGTEVVTALSNDQLKRRSLFGN